MFKQFLAKCLEGKTLTEEEAYVVMNDIMLGKATPSQIASLISILRFRGETVEEITGFARSMRSHMKTIDYRGDELIDTCGTGGDGSSTFNISTATAILLASLGVKVAKHGNRSVSSKSGSADVLENLGIKIQSTPVEAEKALVEDGMSFLFAPVYHEAMKHAVVPRKEIGFRTIFNLLGPLSNPARCTHQLLGVYDTTFAEKMAYALKSLGSKRVLLVTGRDGLDECSISTETDVVELNNNKITRFVLKPEEVGLKRGEMKDIQVSSVNESAALLERVLNGSANETAINIVLLNAGAALYTLGKCDTIKEGVNIAKQAIDTGRAKEKLDSLKSTQEKKNYA